MAQPIIQVEGLGKKYLVGHQAAERERYTTLRDVFARNVRGLWRKTRDIARGRQIVTGDTVEEFWALKDVSFDVQPGEVVGIIGRNGAGKSTLLKILSRITEPTEGKVTLRGRVASLLEVGTGFHPELTGRENIYLNGAILGMTRAEIRRKFDEIVAFAEIEKFLDTPVKRYSSGMYVRLAFSVAAHLDPEILIVDEVLAVGDSEFQRKCIERMGVVARAGRAVLLVSHNMASVSRLCSRTVWLHHGRVVCQAPTAIAVAEYLRALSGNTSRELVTRTDRRGSGRVRLMSMRVASEERSEVLRTGSPAIFEFDVQPFSRGITCCFTIYSSAALPLLHFNSSMRSSDDTEEAVGEGTFSCTVAELPLLEGRYWINAAISDHHDLLDHVEAATLITVEQGALAGRSLVGKPAGCELTVRHRWETPKVRTAPAQGDVT
jgi:lipopolysaccharide transport system ATP-binding protein